MSAHIIALNLQAEEVEREKKLILEGKIPVKEASKELLEHPVFKITQLTKDIIEEQKAKVSAVKVHVSSVGRFNCFCKGPHALSWAGSRAALVKVTISGTPKCLDCCVIV
jgi:hypothetical protein